MPCETPTTTPVSVHVRKCRSLFQLLLQCIILRSQAGFGSVQTGGSVPCGTPTTTPVSVHVRKCHYSFYKVLFYGHRLDLDRCRPVDQCPVKHQPPLPSPYMYVNVARCSTSFYNVLFYAHRLDLDRCRPVDQCPVEHQPPLPSLYMYVNVATPFTMYYFTATGWIWTGADQWISAL